MPISVRELIAIPHLRTRAWAGAAGIDRHVAWAHVCELQDPTEWLGEGDLLLTTGLGIPTAADDQRVFVERLAAAGLSGIAIGDRMFATISSEMVAAADEHRFPLLLTFYDVPFTAVVRAVAEANRSEEHAHVLDILRLYETVSYASITDASADLLARLERVVDCDLHLIDATSGLPAVLGGSEPAPEVIAALREAMTRLAGPMPAVLRLEIGSKQTMAFAVAASRPAAMLAVPRTEACVDMALLRHVAAIAGLTLEHETAARERQRALGAELLGGLVDGSLAPESVAELLAERGLDREPRVLAACRTEPVSEAARDLQVRLEQQGVPHLLLRRSALLLLLLADDPAAIAAVRAAIAAATPLGLSSSLGRLSRTAEAEREARWALEAVRADGASVLRYGEHAASFFLPQGLSTAESAVRQVLGALLDYDGTHRSELIKSLRTFLFHNRSWKDAAGELQVHKQTLVYRMRRVEQITGRRLNDTGDVAELWFALRAADLTAPLLDQSSNGRAVDDQA